MKRVYYTKLGKFGYCSYEDYRDLILCKEDVIIVHFSDNVMLLSLEDIVPAERVCAFV